MKNNLVEHEAAPVRPDAPSDTRLRDALEALRLSPSPVPVRDPETGHIVALLSLPDPPRLGGMATPLGVYLHDGLSSGGAGFWGLVLTGVTMSLLALLAQALAFALARTANVHLPALAHGEAVLPLGVQLWLSSIAGWLSLPLVFLLLRLLPLSGTHAAEHQVVHCIERQAPLLPEYVRVMPRVHPRCGTNIFTGFTLFMLVFLGVFSACQAGAWPVADAVTLSAFVAAPLALALRLRVGGWVQLWFATRPASDRQIAGAIRAAEQVLSRRAVRLRHGVSPRLLPLRRVWAMGLVQILVGYAAVLGLLTALTAAWPPLARWMEM